MNDGEIFRVWQRIVFWKMKQGKRWYGSLNVFNGQPISLRDEFAFLLGSWLAMI